MTDSKRSGPWWRYPHMWLVVGGPAVVVVAGFVTLYLAISHPDPVYSDAPRASRSGNLVLALFAFIVYYNFMVLGQSWVASGKVQLWTSFFLIHGIIDRSFSPTTSIECCAVIRRRDRSVGAPARFSRMKSFAYSPVWMRSSIARIACFVSDVMIFGPLTYSPYSALLLIE